MEAANRNRMVEQEKSTKVNIALHLILPASLQWLLCLALPSLFFAWGIHTAEVHILLLILTAVAGNRRLQSPAMVLFGFFLV